MELDYIATRVLYLADRLRRGASQYYRTHYGIGMGEWRILVLLGGEEGMSANQMCAAADLDKAAVSRGLRVLEAKGWIVLAGSPRSRRRVVTLTDEGRRVRHELIARAEEREDRLLADLGADEVATLERLLDTLIGRVDDMNAVPANAPDPSPARRARQAAR